MDRAEHERLHAEILERVEGGLGVNPQFAPGAPAGAAAGLAGGVAGFARQHAPQLIDALLSVASAAAGPLAAGDMERLKVAVADQAVAALVGLLGSLRDPGPAPAA